MEIGNAYIPMDWRHVFANDSSLEEIQTGAALFADISGFTPLTEAFARELGPKRGGEELTVHLNRVYDGLIGVLHRYGGSVVSFSGDAITCWLDQDLDGRRAVRCALEMQSVMQSLAKIVTPAGRQIVLGLKVAVAIGQVKRFIVGLPEYTLMDAMAGRTVESMASAEHVAERGDVVVDKRTFDALEAHLDLSEWREDEASGESFAIVRALQLDIPELPWATLDDSIFTQAMINHWLLPSVGSRINAGMGEFLTELRPAAALFLRFSGIDYDDDPEATLKLNSFVQLVQRIMIRFDGSLLQLTIGDKGSYLYAAFGAPVAHEDDIERAALAALTLQTEVQQFDFIDPIQIGISYGRMRTGAYGAVQRRTYGVLGDHVNLSARLMSKAPGDQIYVSHNAYRKIKDIFVWEQLPPIKVKGKTGLIEIYRLVDRKQRQTFKLHEPGYKYPMVGRQTELAEIDSKIDLVLAGQGQIVGITADAGMGKSRLTTEVAKIALEKGLSGYAGECQSFGTNTSYLVWHTVWRAWFNLEDDQTLETQIAIIEASLRGIDPTLVPRLPLLGPALNLPIPDNELTASLDAKTKKSLFEGLIVDLLRDRSQFSPLLIVLEDCHWLDDLSKDLITEIGKYLESLPIMLILVYRPPESGEAFLPNIKNLSYFSEFLLNQFSEGEAIQLIDLKIEEFFGNQNVPKRFVDLIISKASGNPFYLDEIVNLIQDRAVDPTDEAALLALDLPDTIYSLVLSRIDSLSESQKIAIRVASVIGRLFKAVMVWGIYPAEEVTSMIKHDLEYLSKLELTPLDQPEPELTYIFKHIVTQEVAYESLPFSTRAKLHGQIGSFLEFKDPDNIEKNLDLLAFHYGRSRNTKKKRHYLKLAGDAAKETYANGAAINYYSELLPLLSNREMVDVQLELGEVQDHIGLWDAAEKSYADALAFADAADMGEPQARARVALGELRRKQGNYIEAEQWLDEALSHSEMIDDFPGIAKVYICLGTLNAQQGKLDESLELYNRSLNLSLSLNDERNMGKVLNNMAVVAEYKGDVDQSLAYFEESLVHQRNAGDKLNTGRLLGNVGYALIGKGELKRAHDSLTEGLAILREIGDKWWIANTLNNLGKVHTMTGAFDLAIPNYKESLQLYSDLGDKWALSFLLEDIASMLAQRSRSPIAIHLAGAADALRTEIESPLSDTMKEQLMEALEPAHTELGDGASAAWEYGRSLGLEHAISSAMTVLAQI